MLVALVLSSLLQAASVAGAPVDSSFHLQTYTIAGSSSRELWDRIRQLGPLDAKDGKRYAAFTRWHVDWHYWYSRRGDRCDIDRSKVSLDTVMTLPAWTDPADGSAALQAEWGVFVSRLKQHESGHRDNGMQAAVAIRQAIDDVGSSPDCKALGDRIDAAARAAIARANQADLDYDANTRHGRTQGAVLP